MEIKGVISDKANVLRELSTIIAYCVTENINGLYFEIISHL